ncbi:MAG: tyrosine--tRNA ligase, partial [Conexivisphaera sp.]
PKNGDDVAYGSYEELAREFREGRLHPMDLKRAMARVINEVVDPVRRMLAGNEEYLRLLGA